MTKRQICPKWYKFCPKLHYLFYIASLEGKNTPFDRCCYYIKVYYCLHFCFKTNVVVKKLSKDCQKVVTCTTPLSLKQPTTYKSRRKQCHGRFLDIFSASLLAQFTESHSSAMCITTTTTTIVLSGWLIDG